MRNETRILMAVGAAALMLFVGLAFVVYASLGRSDGGPPVVNPEPPPWKANAPSGDAWHDITAGPAVKDDVEVSIGRVAYTRPIWAVDGSFVAGENPMLIVKIRVRNLSKTRIVDYKTWSPTSATSSLDTNSGTLSDTFGNNYKALVRNTDRWVDGQVPAKELQPGDEVGDVLVFSRPVRNVEKLRLRLPMSRIGKSGDVLIEIPAAMIQWVADEKESKGN